MNDLLNNRFVQSIGVAAIVYNWLGSLAVKLKLQLPMVEE